MTQPDQEDIFPLQHLLNIKYTPLEQLMEYVAEMVTKGARLEQITSDNNEEEVQDRKVYQLKDMEDGYQAYNRSLCVVEVWEWKSRRGTFFTVHTPMELESGTNTKIHVHAKRQNLVDISKDDIICRFPILKRALDQALYGDEAVLSEDEDGDDDDDAGDDGKEEEEPAGGDNPWKSQEAGNTEATKDEQPPKDEAGQEKDKDKDKDKETATYKAEAVYADDMSMEIAKKMTS